MNRPLPGEDYPPIEEVYERVRGHWDFESLAPLPIPTFKSEWWRCPSCGGSRPTYRSWRFFQRANSRVPWRCDVNVKCTDCSNVPYRDQGAKRAKTIALEWQTIHGLIIPPEYVNVVEAFCARQMGVSAKVALISSKKLESWDEKYIKAIGLPEPDFTRREGVPAA